MAKGPGQHEYIIGFRTHTQASLSLGGYRAMPDTYAHKGICGAARSRIDRSGSRACNRRNAHSDTLASRSPRRSARQP